MTAEIHEAFKKLPMLHVMQVFECLPNASLQLSIKFLSIKIKLAFYSVAGL